MITVDLFTVCLRCVSLRFTEGAKVMRRPLHHIQMVNYVALHYGTSALFNIDKRPDIVEEVRVLLG